MLGCTLAWPTALPVKLRRASGSEFKVWGAGVGAGEEGRMGWAAASPSLTPSLPAPPGPPNVIGPHGPRFVVGLAPGQLVLECSVEADPVLEIEWHREGILLQVGARLGTWGTAFCPSRAQGPEQTGSQMPGTCSPDC